MPHIHVNFADDQPLDIPWPQEVLDERAELAHFDDIDLAGLYKEISKIRLEVVKAARKQTVDGPVPLSEEKGISYLTTAINELRRLQPELANLHDDTEERIKESYLREIFPVIDAFDRFFASVRDVNDSRLQNWLEGIKSIYSTLFMILRKSEVQEVPAHGIFNPKYQSAIGTEVRNDLPPGTILRVERRGYIIGKKILRSPEVIVSKRSDLI